ncbi:MAG: short chain dehydrogenase [Micavibrio sp.]|nr:short chain dehydrogenase [Micavibrio sp.]
MSADLKEKTIFITGGSRGIGLAIALRAAADGANIVIAAKTDEPHPQLSGTIHSAVEQIENAGGRGLAVKMDVRDEAQVSDAVDKAAAHFGGIDILVNNASAIFLSRTSKTPMKRFDLMHQINVRGTFMTAQKALPYLKQSDNPHILTLSPPIDMRPKWFENHLAYTMSKYGMSMCTIGLAAELSGDGIACNSLWPRTLIYTAALRNLGEIKPENCRTENIVADAAHVILSRDSRQHSGHFYIDEDVLREAGVHDFSSYNIKDGASLITDLYLDE